MIREAKIGLLAPPIFLVVEYIDFPHFEFIKGKTSFLPREQMKIQLPTSRNLTEVRGWEWDKERLENSG